MKKLSYNEISGIEFPDCDILTYSFNESRLDLTTDGAYIEGKGLVKEKILVTIESWDEVSVARYSEGIETELDINESGILREICESEFSKDLVKLAGFEKNSGHWQTMKFLNSTVSISIE